MPSETNGHHRLYQWVKDNDIRVEEMAEKMGRKPGYILSVLMGQQPLTDSVIGAFTRVFGTRATEEAFGLEREPAQ